ncbi:putative salicylate hydroxylase [Viridothelium virens]|uniref:Putative salicylate hydroxylase n=1 Tax=Viridothelium virens TaxID=1048519 RepID=A0A6A6HEL8_VIRVR|nr:putative salicylate hydroxylase [Viridothelium virens]
MAIPISNDIVIIGAGLAGLTLALSLHAEGIPCTIYDLRVPNRTIGGALMLAPNALRVLDSLSLYSRLQPLGWSFSTLTYQNEAHETTGSYDFGVPAKHGYAALRIYRDALLTEVRAAAEERGIPIHHGHRFSHVVSESADEGVVFAFEDGTTRHASLLVGADGIHSTVRGYVCPDLASGPQYSGLVAAVGAVDRVKIKFPEGGEKAFQQPVTLQGEHGAMVFAPQTAEGSELLIGRQFPYPEQDHAGWKALIARKDEVEGLLRRDEKAWPEMVQSALRNLKKEKLNVWAYYVIPKLARWTSEMGRVVIVGDSSHAIPPTAGQGATQAFEDGASLATLVAKLPEEANWSEALQWWQGMRQKRVDQVLDLTSRLNNARAPKEERDKLPMDNLWQSEGQEDLGWLYNYRVKETVQDWIERKTKGKETQEL